MKMSQSLSWRRIGLQAAVIFTSSVVLVGVYWFGFAAGRQFPETVEIRAVEAMAGEESVDFGLFWQAWSRIDEKYLRAGEVADQEKVYGAVAGLVQALNDPYSTFLPPADAQKFEEDIRGNFGGIGAELGIRRGEIVIIAPLKNSPASRADLRAGDRILEVNSSSTFELTLDEAVSWIRGPIGTEVTLTVMREEWEEPREITVQRADIEIPTLDWEMKGDIAYFALYSFNARAEGVFYEAVRKALAQGARGIVFDVRNNPGGYLEVAVDLASWFVPQGSLIVSEAGREGEDAKFEAAGNAALVDVPTVVLINGGSASAAEIFAGALRDIRQVVLVGEQSFGKGSVQQLFPLILGSSLKLTIAQWVLPSGEIIEGEGLTPTHAVELTEEDQIAGRDPQLDSALEIVRLEIGQL